MRALPIALLLVGCGAAACGGSSSETPWPMEPIDIEPGPLGEAPPSGDATDVGPAPELAADPDEEAELDEEEGAETSEGKASP